MTSLALPAPSNGHGLCLQIICFIGQCFGLVKVRLPKLSATATVGGVFSLILIVRGIETVLPTN